MLDRFALPVIKAPLQAVARQLAKKNISADQVTITGFALGLFAVPAIAFGFFKLALVAIIANRIADGLDGALARQSQPSDRGAYLDIVLDFIFYAAIVFAFALHDPAQNALSAAALLFSFMGTGSSFLAFAILAERKKLTSMIYPNKGFYYLNGITEGTETILFFVAMCLWPSYFVVLAWVFFSLCVVTTVTRIISGAHTLKNGS